MSKIIWIGLSDVKYLKTDYLNKIFNGMDWKYDFKG